MSINIVSHLRVINLELWFEDVWYEILQIDFVPHCEQYTN